jgi:hypothetical protein
MQTAVSYMNVAVLCRTNSLLYHSFAQNTGIMLLLQDISSLLLPTLLNSKPGQYILSSTPILTYPYALNEAFTTS